MMKSNIENLNIGRHLQNMFSYYVYIYIVQTMHSHFYFIFLCIYGANKFHSSLQEKQKSKKKFYLIHSSLKASPLIFRSVQIPALSMKQIHGLEQKYVFPMIDYHCAIFLRT
jgi:hypothetical protein